jgi:hypothetical protein
MLLGKWSRWPGKSWISKTTGFKASSLPVRKLDWSQSVLDGNYLGITIEILPRICSQSTWWIRSRTQKLLLISSRTQFATFQRQKLTPSLNRVIARISKLWSGFRRGHECPFYHGSWEIVIDCIPAKSGSYGTIKNYSVDYFAAAKPIHVNVVALFPCTVISQRDQSYRGTDLVADLSRRRRD